MESAKEYNLHMRNEVYYNQISSSEPMRFDILKNKENFNEKPKVAKKSTSFALQEVDLSKIVFAPDGYESIFYTAYFVLIPYIVGNIFLFIFISNGVFSNYKLLDTGAFFIVWIIGYEIVATLSLLWIMVLYLKYDKQESEYKYKIV